jgi:hypothetical protein
MATMPFRQGNYAQVLKLIAHPTDVNGNAILMAKNLEFVHLFLSAEMGWVPFTDLLYSL